MLRTSRPPSSPAAPLESQRWHLRITSSPGSCQVHFRRSSPIQKPPVHVPRSRERAIQTLHQLHTPIEQRLVRESLPGPALENFVDAITFFAAEFAVRQIRVVNDFGNRAHSSVTNLELFLQGLERTVIATMAAASLVEHVERHGFAWHLVFGREGKASVGVDEAPNEPRRSRTVDARPRSRYPYPALVVARTNHS